MKIDESVAKLKIGDLVRSTNGKWIGTIVDFEEARSRLYGKDKGLLPIIHWTCPEEGKSWNWRCHPNNLKVISENR